MSVKSIKAYHGTNKHAYSLIQQNGFKIPKYDLTVVADRTPKLPGDLGAGLYAFENSKENASKFISKFEKVEQDRVVCELHIEVDKEHILDMDEEKNIDYFNSLRNSSTYRDLHRRFMGHRSRRKCLDGLIIEHILLKTGNRTKLVKKRTFTPFDDIQISQFSNGNEVCIRDVGIIKEHAIV